MRCPGCGRRITANVAEVYAVQLQRIDTARGTDYVEGVGGFFHDRECLARARDWREKPKPV